MSCILAHLILWVYTREGAIEVPVAAKLIEFLHIWTGNE